MELRKGQLLAVAVEGVAGGGDQDMELGSESCGIFSAFVSLSLVHT